MCTKGSGINCERHPDKRRKERKEKMEGRNEESEGRKDGRKEGREERAVLCPLAEGALARSSGEVTGCS